METVSIRIIEPKIRRLLDDLESLKLIEIRDKKRDEKPRRRFGSMKGLVVHIADDFDATTKDFDGNM